ncbi:AraC family transcriptional regulator [Escherichia coli]|nr:AraC family transcriptional regulator [Escherichia coli]
MQLKLNEGCYIIFNSETLIIEMDKKQQHIDKNSLTFIVCKNKTIKTLLRSKNFKLIKISHDIIKKYLLFHSPPLIPDTKLNHYYDNTTILTVHYDYPCIFNSAVQSTSNTNTKYLQSLLFAIMSEFLNDDYFIPILIDLLHEKKKISNKIYHIIKNNITNKWTLAKISETLGTSPSSLKKKLMNEKTSYSEIITSCRMHYAVNLIQSKPSIQLSELAKICGYNNISYFIYVFRKYYNVTPLQYIKLYKANKKVTNFTNSEYQRGTLPVKSKTQSRTAGKIHHTNQ